MPPNTALQPGSSGPQVLQLQQYLLSQGLLTQADINTGPGIYGPKTTAAVNALQQKLGVNNSSGPGYWGPQTIAKVTQTPAAAPTQYAGGKAPDDPSNQYNTATGQPNPNYNQNSSGGAFTVPDALQQMAKNNPFIADLIKDPANSSLIQQLATNPTLLAGFLEQAKAVPENIQSGKVLNPNLDITNPDVLKRYMDNAHSLLDPYYKEQMGFQQKDLQTAFDRLSEDYNNTASRSEDVFKQTLGANAEDAAQKGTTYSSGRVDAENRAVTTQQNALDDTLKNATRSAQDTLNAKERQIGSSALAGMGLPSLNAYQATTSGYTPLGSRSINLSGGITGTDTYNQQNTIEQKARSLNLNDVNDFYTANNSYN